MRTALFALPIPIVEPTPWRELVTGFQLLPALIFFVAALLLLGVVCALISYNRHSRERRFRRRAHPS
jgi:hypothetical protein